LRPILLCFQAKTDSIGEWCVDTDSFQINWVVDWHL
jgi:hypothetical protein